MISSFIACNSLFKRSHEKIVPDLAQIVSEPRVEVGMVSTARMKVGATALLDVEALAAEVRGFLREECGPAHATLPAETNGCGREQLVGEWN